MDFSSEEIEEALMHLFKMGLVKVDYDENLEARFQITDNQKFEQYLKEQRGDV
jgi:hypothetical protein